MLGIAVLWAIVALGWHLCEDPMNKQQLLARREYLDMVLRLLGREPPMLSDYDTGGGA